MDKIKKLKLNKEVIANLNNVEMNQIRGGNISLSLDLDCVSTPLLGYGGAQCGTITCDCGGGDKYGGSATIVQSKQGCATYTWNGCVQSVDMCNNETQGCNYTDPYW